jgi:hypothetical protein
VPKGNIEIDCKEVWMQISSYLDDELPPELRATMAAHFRECGHCIAVLDGTRNVVQLLGDGRVFEVPAGAGQQSTDALSELAGLHNVPAEHAFTSMPAAVVAPRNLEYGLSRMWQVFVEESG